MAKRINLNPLNMVDVSHEPEWYTIIVKHNYEKKYASDLFAAVKANAMQDKILEVVAPLKEEEVISTNKKNETKKTMKIVKVYPLYVFVKAIISPDVWTFLRSIDGFITVLATGGIIVTITEPEMNVIKDQCGILEKEVEMKRRQALEKLENNKSLYSKHIGKPVKIVNGMFSTYDGVLNKIDFNKNRVNVSVMNASLDMDLLDIELY